MKINQDDFIKILDTCYEKALNGIPASKSCTELATEYLEKYGDSKIAAKHFITRQVEKCTTSGFITSLGGLITLPIAVPANLTTVWYIQLRMIATLAIIGGYDPSSDEVQTLAYVCLTGCSLSKICKEFGINFGNKITIQLIKKIPSEILTAINKKMTFRFITKFGEKGMINLSKLVPIVGGVIGGSFDFVGTELIGSRATKIFLCNEIE